MNRSNVELIKERIPIEDLIGSYVKLEKAGKSFKAKCPFHNEKSASFFVSPDRGGYYCFGCGAKGDIFSFVEQFEGLDFRGALKILAERAGVQLVFDQKADGERDRLFQIMEDSAKFFEDQLGKSKEAREYVANRGISGATRAEFRIGWAPEGWSNLHAYLKGKGWNDPIIEKAGLAKKGDKGDFYDRFRGRIMFPITDSSGRVIAFSGRILKPDDKSAKYLNSPDTPLYDKSAVLYGLDKAKSEIRRLDYSILVEGQMDLVMSHQAGIKNTVAASGTALSGEFISKEGVINNLGLIRRLSPNVIIAFDSDEAGRKAAMRAVASTALSLGMAVKIADISGGKDPADLVKENVTLWKDVLKGAKHVIEYELGNVLRDEPDPRKSPRELRERVFPFLVQIESSTDKAYFIKVISDKTGLPEQAIWEDMRAVEKKMKEQGTGYRVQGIGKPQTTPTTPYTVHPTPLRLDLVERRMFGLLNLMESAKLPQAADYREQIKKIAGASYDERMKRVEVVMNDVLFEAEAFFGVPNERWDMHMKELMLNFEEDLINGELMATMQELRIAEKAGQQEKVGQLAKKCQELSMRKAELGKKRR